MKAYQFESPATGLTLVDLAEPTPGPGQVVIDVGAAGICRSDVHILKGHGDDWLRKRPIVLGHEVAGTVTALGPQADGVAIGDRVAVASIIHPIEQADFKDAIGLGFDGGYALKAAVPVRNLMPIPDGVPFTHAAVATDAIATAYHAVVTEAEIAPGSIAVIVGLGGLGLSAVRIAALQGATVYGVDVNTTVFDNARDQGAAACVTSIFEVPEGIDVVLDFAGMGATTADAIAAVKPGGCVVVVGLGVAEATLSTNQIVTKNIQVRGSLGASFNDLKAVLDLLADGSLVPLVEEVPFDDLEAALERLERGEVQGRLVTCPTS
ncbi:zinc-binding dehydrogenase [Mycobacterium vicinigordonae]|uniref:Zinc-binding dehydrogenase n=1 Tax=Mycobacterium vicinigordonae TaxID=1719132 RepID=A0A7D6I5X2_9MYCO|nr:zinc-binding dehydrogenase [Mycobacterium vicinigordonae]QLL06516.1 zinc-binding dehydrogenase [Mycobacterium vicinigordonae]